MIGKLKILAHFFNTKVGTPSGPVAEGPSKRKQRRATRQRRTTKSECTGIESDRRSSGNGDTLSRRWNLLWKVSAKHSGFAWGSKIQVCGAVRREGIDEHFCLRIIKSDVIRHQSFEERGSAVNLRRIRFCHRRHSNKIMSLHCFEAATKFGPANAKRFFSRA